MVEIRTLGRSGLKVSRACLGAMNFGTSANAPCDEREARSIIDAFLDGGNNFIDTANVYTGGQSEEIVGRAVKTRRDKVVVATKGRGPQGDGPNDIGLSRLHLTRALDASLRRLDLDYVDLYQVHFPDADTPIEETMETLAGFVRTGKVRYIGCSNFLGSQIVEAQWAASRQNGIPFTSLQPRYSLIARDIEADVLPACGRNGLGTLVYSPLGGGLLTGKYKEGQDPAEGTRYARNTAWASGVLNERNFRIVDTVKQVAKELDTTPTAVALAWVLSRNHVTCAIVGPRTLQQLKENLVGFELKLPPETIKRLSDASRPLGAPVGLPRRRT
jgi:aryl-alcohol dehydrogenase-like predicted oxidoreductase